MTHRLPEREDKQREGICIAAVLYSESTSLKTEHKKATREL